MKTFKEYLDEGTGASATELVPEKDSDAEATEYEPRSDGEKDFADLHKGGKKKHPVAGEHQHTHDAKQASHDAAGEKSVIKQGSSKVA